MKELRSDVRTAVKRLALEKGTLTTAESCTGGLLAVLLTEISGVSVVFRGGVVSYHNDLKREVLGVKDHTLQAHGAVSRMVAKQMAEGARKHFKSQWALATTGIAGPGGGTPKKPVGLCYIAVSGPKRTQVKRLLYKGLTRRQNQLVFAKEVFGLLLKEVKRFSGRKD